LQPLIGGVIGVGSRLFDQMVVPLEPGHIVWIAQNDILDKAQQVLGVLALGGQRIEERPGLFFLPVKAVPDGSQDVVFVLFLHEVDQDASAVAGGIGTVEFKQAIGPRRQPSMWREQVHHPCLSGGHFGLDDEKWNQIR